MKILRYPDATEPAGEPVAELTPEEKAAKAVAAIDAIAAVATTIVGIAAPGIGPIVAGIATILHFAPSLYPDLMLLFSNGAPSQAQLEEFKAKLAVLLNPGAAYADK